MGNNGNDTSGYAIFTEGLVKRFGKTTALNGLDLKVRTGHIHGFLGPNGAGKSTTIRVLLGLLRKDSGTVRLLGGDPWNDPVSLHGRLAYIPGEVNLWPNLSGGEAIDLIMKLRGSPNKQRRDELIRRFELDPTKRFRTYSKGNRQKVAIIAALASDVELYLLDEPTSGLDPLMETVFQDCVKELRGAGKTILLSSHILSEVEALCDHVSIIREGRIVESGTLDQMRHLTRTTVIAKTRQPAGDLAQLAGVHSLKHDGKRVEFEVEPEALDKALQLLTKHGVAALTSHPPTLEEIFMRHYGDALPDEPELAKVR